MISLSAEAIRHYHEHGYYSPVRDEEKHDPVSDIDTAATDSLKALDLKWPIREADMAGPADGSTRS
jgi:hypothetical protein